jgi:hypothetical protein
MVRNRVLLTSTFGDCLLLLHCWSPYLHWILYNNNCKSHIDRYPIMNILERIMYQSIDYCKMQVKLQKIVQGIRFSQYFLLLLLLYHNNILLGFSDFPSHPFYLWTCQNSMVKSCYSTPNEDYNSCTRTLVCV